MPSTGYWYYTVVMANALLAEGGTIPDNAVRRPDQMLRNLLSAYGYENDDEVSYVTLLHDLERDGLFDLLKDLEAKNYWSEFIGRVALPEVPGQYTMSDPILPLLDAAPAFERAVGMLFNSGDLLAGSDIQDLRYLLDGVTLDEVVQRVAEREPAVANALLRATRRAGAPFDEHPLSAQFVLARLFEATEQVLECWLFERPESERVRVVGTSSDGVRLLARRERFLEKFEDEKKRKVSVDRVESELATVNGDFARQIGRLRLRAPGHLGLAKPDARFRPQHVLPELTREGNPLKVVAQDLKKKKADPALKLALQRVTDLHRDPSISLVLALALPGADPVVGMLEQALELRRLGEGDDWRFPSGRTLLAWLYGSKTGVSPAGVPTELANFAERDRLGLACPSVLAEEASADVERRLDALGLDPGKGGGTNVVAGCMTALLDVLPVVAPGRDPHRWRDGTEATSTTAEQFWAKAAYPHLMRIAWSRTEFRDRLKDLPGVRGRPVPWSKVFGRSDDDDGESELPRRVGLDFTEVWPSDEVPLAPDLHPFGRLAAERFDVEGEAWSFDDKLMDWSARLIQRRGEVLPETTGLLLRTLQAWVERIRLQEEPKVADARTRLFFVDGGKAGERAGFAPRSVGLPATDPSAWASDGPPPYAFVERFTLDGDTVQADREQVLDALQAFLEVVREVEAGLRHDWWTVMEEMKA